MKGELIMMIFMSKKEREEREKAKKKIAEGFKESFEKNRMKEEQNLVETSELTLVVKLNKIFDETKESDRETMAKLKEIFGDDIDEVEIRPIRKEN